MSFAWKRKKCSWRASMRPRPTCLNRLRRSELKISGNMTNDELESNRHVRRQIRGQLKDAIKQEQRFKFSRETSNRRWAVIAAYVGLMLFFVGTLISAVYLNTGGRDDYWNELHQAFAILGFVVTAGFFLRWLNSWANRTADEEFRLKQLELDIDRASWLVELVQESGAEPDPTPMSPQLIERLSRNLFAGGNLTDDHAMTATDALATALLGTAARLKVPLGGAELEFDKPAMNKLRKTHVDEG
jgi:hypothetical protein